MLPLCDPTYGIFRPGVVQPGLHEPMSLQQGMEIRKGFGFYPATDTVTQLPFAAVTSQ